MNALRLCLRIPGVKELSPPPRPAGSPTSFTLPKPSSPIPSIENLHHRAPTQTSAYTRIVSKKNIKTVSLPSFLQESNQLKSASNKHTSQSLGQSSDQATESSSIKIEETKLEALHSANTEIFIKQIFSKRLPKDQILLKIGNLHLTRSELQTFDPKLQLSRMSIDACLRVIKVKNRKLFSTAEIFERVLIFDTNFAQQLFTSEKPQLSVHHSPLKYEYLVYRYVLFPLYIEYWTLVCLDTKLKKLIIYNVENTEIASEILTCIKRFIRQELKGSDKKSLDVAGWRGLVYQLVQIPEVPLQDTSVLLLKLAYKISLNPKLQIMPDRLTDFRYILLLMLCKYHSEDTLA